MTRGRGPKPYCLESDAEGRSPKMHGLLFSELKKFVVSKLGADSWNKLLVEAGLASKIYMPNQTYSDEELVRLVTTASRMTGIPVADLEEAFGEFIAPELLKLYSTQINPAWRTLDVVEKTETFVHRAVRLKVPGASPPRGRIRRRSSCSTPPPASSAPWPSGSSRGRRARSTRP